MPAVIPILIAPQNFEVIRGKIRDIIALEYGNQYSKDHTLPLITTIWEERCREFNADEGEIPTINVTISRGDYSNQSNRKAIGDYLYNIDVYTSAPTTAANGKGDQYAMEQMNRVVGIIRAILVHPAYQTLTLAKGIIQGLPRVERFFVADKNTVKDALSNVVGRVQFAVSAIETMDGLIDPGVPLQISTLTVTREGSPEGYFVRTNYT